jgi:DHA1 family bicyclomycin/chloramphenicol resistance-like MFS transporter
VAAVVLGRALQGAAMAAAVVCGRAMVRDLYEPQEGGMVMARALTGLGASSRCCRPSSVEHSPAGWAGARLCRQWR